MADLLGPEIAGALNSQGIQSLYPPQAESWGPVSAGRNVVVAIPTAAGKSLIAYLAILRRHLERPNTGKALYIVPLRALASEKYDELRTFESMGLRVAIATGDPEERTDRLGRFDVIVTTSEKADSLLRHRVPWLSQVDLVVSDEVHLINDGSRGPTLEVLLARLRSTAPSLQVIALSATVANAAEVASWLDAELVSSGWRPTPLKKGILLGKVIEFDDGSHRTLSVDDKDAVAALVVDIIEEGGQALVFVNTRRSAEAVARRVAPKVGKRLTAESKRRLAALAKEVAGPGEPSRTGAKLAEPVSKGASFHTAGLDSKQRRLIERAFRDGDLRCLVATPTLAAGVNTPARRVVVRDVYRYEANMGMQPLPVMEVLQMMGRAGRPRFDPYGEAVLIAKTEDERETLRASYIEADPEPIRSKLGAEPALRMHILATVAAGFADGQQGVHAFLDSTFYAHQGESWLIKEHANQVLDFLVDNGFLQQQEARLVPTRFGKRTSDLYVDPMSALTLRKAIENAQGRDDVTTFAWLHAIAATVDLRSLFLNSRDDWVWNKAAQEEEGLLLGVTDVSSQEDFLSYVKTASLLEDWIEEAPMDRIEERYGIGPGDVRDKVDRGRWLAHAARELARVLEFETMRQLNDLPLRIETGARAELLPLIKLDGIGRVRARQLHKAGFGGIAKLRAAPLEKLQAVPTIGTVLARRILEQVGGESTPRERSPGTTLEAF